MNFRAHNGAAIWWILALLLVLGAAAYYWFFVLNHEAPPDDVQRPTVSPPRVVVEPPAEPEEDPRPRPAPATAQPVEEPEEESPPLPALADSDDAARASAERLLGESAVRETLVTEGMISRLVAAVDALTLEQVPARIAPVSAPEGPFAARALGSSEQVNPETGLPETLYELDADNFARYTPQVEIFEAIDTADLVAQYRRFYPLLLQSYQELRPDGDFDDRVMEVIDHLLATPEPERPVQLVKPEAYYEFADPDLEARSAGQKLLIRMGPSNASRVKAKLVEIRAALAQTQRE